VRVSQPSNLLQYLTCLKNGCSSTLCAWKGRIVVFQDSLDKANLEYCGTHDPDAQRTKPLRVCPNVKQSIRQKANIFMPSEICYGMSILKTFILLYFF
jgi:hypothetical protein